MSGWKDWAVGEVVEESDFQSFVQDQVVQVYDNSGARGSALGTAVAEGMVSYLKDTNLVEVYDGSGWQNFTGDITAVTAGTALTGGGTSGAVTLNVDQDALFTDGTSGFTMVSGGTAGVTYQPISPNYIINGAFDIWQRGTSFTAGARAYSVDRYTIGRSGNVAGLTASRSTDVPDNYVYSIKVQRDSGNTATNTLGLHQQLEDAGKLVAGQTVTISFWAKAGADFNGSFSARQNSSSAEWSSITYSTGGAMNSGNADFDSSSVTIAPTTTWTRYSFTATIPTTANSLQVHFLYTPVGTAGADDSFYITGWQLEAGSVATPFRRNANSTQGELAACQRYFQAYGGDAVNQFFGSGLAVGTTLGAFSFLTQTTLRAAPTVTFSNVTHFSCASATGALLACTNLTANNASATSVGLTGTVASGLVAGNGSLLRSNTTDARIFASAEL